MKAKMALFGQHATDNLQDGWEIGPELETVDIGAAKAAYLKAEKQVNKSNADAFEQGTFDGFRNALDLLRIDYSDWQ